MDAVAVGAVLVALGSLLVTLRVSHNRLVHEALESEKRLAHEERMQAERLKHERVEAIRTTAAKAYSAARSVLVHVTPDIVVTIGHEPIDQGEMNARKLVGEAMDSLSVVAAMGWSEQVQDTALGLREEITNLATDAWRLTKQTRQLVLVPETTAIDLAAHEALKEKVGEGNDRVAACVEAYRKAVAGEAD